MLQQVTPENVPEIDPSELDEWFESLDDLLHRYGPQQVQRLLGTLQERAYHRGVVLPFTANTPYVNSIAVDKQPRYPGNREIERRIKSIIRWNAMAMVIRANRDSAGIGGHISTYASAATLLEVGFNHFFHGRTDEHPGDAVYFQGHASPGIYARAYLEGRLTEEHLNRFRREIPRGTGLSSYPHPWLMPDFWQFPTVSMGLGPLTAIYHARFLRYLHHRKLMDTSKVHVWCYVGDGEVDEPETLGAITLASREHLDNLIFVINCNLQRLDGPVRGNGKIIQELEAAFRGAGWNCLKVIWGSDWDPLLALDSDGQLVHRMGEVVDGQYQKYSVETGAYIRDHFFGANPQLREMVDHLSDEQLQKLNRGGHDPEKVFAAYQAAVEHQGAPSVILAKTIKGYGLGEAGEGRNITHQQKKLNEDELREFRARFAIPIGDDDLAETPFYKPPADSPEMEYLNERRNALGGYVPTRITTLDKLEIPPLETFEELLNGSEGREVATTMAFGRLLSALLKDKQIGKRIVPIIPDEARTFGMEALFRQSGIYACKGQLYEPVDAGQLMYYREARDGQILEEGINEAGAMSSFIAAGTAYANLGLSMVPFYIYYSMFGFQRVGDLMWAAADARCKGFLLGGTSGRTTLNGEGLQHQDGHSHLLLSAVPNCVAYDPAYAYELTIIIQNGLKRMYVDDESVYFYISVYNETYEMPPMPAGSAKGILKGIYKLASVDVDGGRTNGGRTSSPSSDGPEVHPTVSSAPRKSDRKKGDGKKAKGKNKRATDSSLPDTLPRSHAPSQRAQLFGSGPILREAQRAQQILADKYGVSTDLWSVTSYNELRRDAQAVERHNSLHPDDEPQSAYVSDVLAGLAGPFIAASDNIRGVSEQIRRWIPGRYVTLGTDGFGRSDSREALRRHFEVDAECIAYATLLSLSRDGRFDTKKLTKALKELDIDPDKVNPATA